MSELYINIHENDIADGQLISFKAPCDSNGITCLRSPTAFDGLVSYILYDANNHIINGINHIWSENAIVSVIMDKTSRKAYIQNAAEPILNIPRITEDTFGDILTPLDNFTDSMCLGSVKHAILSMSRNGWEPLFAKIYKDDSGTIYIKASSNNGYDMVITKRNASWGGWQHKHPTLLFDQEQELFEKYKDNLTYKPLYTKTITFELDDSGWTDYELPNIYVVRDIRNISTSFGGSQTYFGGDGLNISFNINDISGKRYISVEDKNDEYGGANISLTIVYTKDSD